MYTEDEGSGSKRIAAEENADAPDAKRSRKECFKCGGFGHIAMMCPSPGGKSDPIPALSREPVA